MKIRRRPNILVPQYYSEVFPLSRSPQTSKEKRRSEAYNIQEDTGTQLTCGNTEPDAALLDISTVFSDLDTATSTVINVNSANPPERSFAVSLCYCPNFDLDVDDTPCDQARTSFVNSTIQRIR